MQYTLIIPFILVEVNINIDIKIKQWYNISCIKIANEKINIFSKKYNYGGKKMNFFKILRIIALVCVIVCLILEFNLTKNILVNAVNNNDIQKNSQIVKTGCICYLINFASTLIMGVFLMLIFSFTSRRYW